MILFSVCKVKTQILRLLHGTELIAFLREITLVENGYNQYQQLMFTFLYTLKILTVIFGEMYIEELALLKGILIII